MPPPVPPAAPAPGRFSIMRPFSASMASASRARPASSVATCCASAPFCGANTAAAPSVPVRGLVTSHANHDRDVSPSSGTSVSSMRASRECARRQAAARNRPHRGNDGRALRPVQCRRRWWRCRPIKYDAFRSGVDRGANQLAGAESGRRQRIAVGGGDALDAARRSQLDHRGARILSIVRCSETALAKESISCDDRPAQRVMRVLRSQFAAGCPTSASVNPSPPSDNGIMRHSAPGSPAATPRRIDSATACAEAASLNESGANRYFMVSGSLPTAAGERARPRNSPTFRSNRAPEPAANAAARRPSSRIRNAAPARRQRLLAHASGCSRPLPRYVPRVRRNNHAPDGRD